MNEEPSKPDDSSNEVIAHCLPRLAEHFEAGVIIVSRTQEGGGTKTELDFAAFGNHFAHRGMLMEMLTRLEEDA